MLDLVGLVALPAVVALYGGYLFKRWDAQANDWAERQVAALEQQRVDEHTVTRSSAQLAYVPPVPAGYVPDAAYLSDRELGARLNYDAAIADARIARYVASARDPAVTAAYDLGDAEGYCDALFHRPYLPDPRGHYTGDVLDNFYGGYSDGYRRGQRSR